MTALSAGLIFPFVASLCVYASDIWLLCNFPHSHRGPIAMSESPLKNFFNVASRMVGGLVSASSSQCNDDATALPDLEQSSQMSDASSVPQSKVPVNAGLEKTAAQGTQVTTVAPLGLELNQSNASLAASSLSCDVTAPKETVTVRRALVPIKKDDINREWANQNWGVASHFISVDLPKNNPEEKHVTAFIQVMKGLHGYVCDRLDENLLKHLQALFEKHKMGCISCDPPKTIKSIHVAVLGSAKVFSEDYLHRVLEFLKLPLKQERSWLDQATLDVKRKYAIEFDPAGEEKNFIEAIANYRYNDQHNQRLRRGMVHHTGVTFYDRVPRKKGLDTLFGQNIEVSATNLGDFMVAGFVIRGHLAMRVGNKSPTGCEQVSVDTLKQALAESKTESEILAAVALWKTANKVRCFILTVSY